jgi:hypothetical protein
MLIEHWGTVPEEAWAKARRAYGQSIDTSYMRAIELVSDQAYLARCLKMMAMESTLIDRIPESLRSSLPASGAVLSPAPF